METLNVVVAEILLCLALAWVLGFLASWILFRKVQNEYEQEIEELEENLSYVSASNKNQEREIIEQSLKLQEFEKTLGKNIKSRSEKLNIKKEEIKKEDILKNKKSSKEKKSQDEEILRLIEGNLYSPKKK